MVSRIAGHRLDPRSLEEEMRRDLPPGALKSDVVEFVRRMRPLRYYDYGQEVTARWLEETGDLIHSWDIVVVFSFDADGRLLCYSQIETDFIDYDLRALMRH